MSAAIWKLKNSQVRCMPYLAKEGRNGPELLGSETLSVKNCPETVYIWKTACIFGKKSLGTDYSNSIQPSCQVTAKYSMTPLSGKLEVSFFPSINTISIQSLSPQGPQNSFFYSPAPIGCLCIILENVSWSNTFSLIPSLSRFGVPGTRQGGAWGAFTIWESCSRTHYAGGARFLGAIHSISLCDQYHFPPFCFSVMDVKPILLSTSFDQTIRLWDLTNPSSESQVLCGVNVPVSTRFNSSVHFNFQINCLNYDGERLVAYGCCTKLDVIDVETCQSVCTARVGGPLPFQRNKVFDHIFSAIGFLVNPILHDLLLKICCRITVNSCILVKRMASSASGTWGERKYMRRRIFK